MYYSNWNSNQLLKQKQIEMKPNGRNKLNLGHRRTNSRRRCLSELESPQPSQVFENALPPFPDFLQHISSTAEYKAKIFKHRTQCYLQIFTYNYLVLCFDSKHADNSQVFLDYIYELIEKPEFQFMLPQAYSQLKEYTPMALKNILSQYLNYMSSTNDTIFASLNKYPPILQIFVAFFRTLLFLGQICNQYEDELDMEETYEFLTSYFDMDVNIGSNYVFFNQSCIYAYQQSMYEVYMFYPNSNTQEISSFLNAVSQDIYKSGYSSVNLIMSNLDESMGSGIQSKPKVQFKNKVHNQNNYKEQAQQQQKGQKRSSILIKKRTSGGKRKTRQAKQQAFQQSKISYNYTQSSKNSRIRLKDSNTLNLMQQADNQERGNQFNKSSIANQFNRLLESKQFINESSYTPQQAQLGQKNSKIIITHKRHVSEMGSNQDQNQLFTAFLKYKNDESKYIDEPVYKKFQKKQNKEDLIDTSETFYRPKDAFKPIKIQKKTPYVWINKNITKQFTSSFVLQTMPQPYRGSIIAKKQKAREIRKSAYTIFS